MADVFEVQGPDGVYEIAAPDAATAAAAFKSLTPQQMQSLAGQAQQAKQSGTWTSGEPTAGFTLDNAGRQIAKGVPFVGNYMDEASAAANAALNPVLGTGSPGANFGERYGANVQRERDIDKAFEQAYPKASTALQVGGGIAGAGGMMGAAPRAANVVFGNIGANIPARILPGAIAGGVQGAVGGYGAGETPEDSQRQAISGGVIGAGMGAVTNPAAAGFSTALNWLRDKALAGRAGAAMGLPEWPNPGAVQRVARNVEADNINLPGARQRMNELGDEGMVMDLGRQLQGRAEASATIPGAGQNTILDAVENRVRGTAQRMGQDLDRELGQSPNVVELANRIEDHFNQQIRPAYDRVMQAHPQVWNQTLQNLTSRPSIQRAIGDATELASENGARIQNPFIAGADGRLALQPGLTPNLAFWDYVKKSLDGRIGAFARNPDLDSAGKTSMAALLDTKRQLVDQLDQITNGTYRQARNIAADKFAVREALDNGLTIFQNRMLPEHFDEMIQGMGIAERAAMEAGARRALERMREVSPANMSEGGRAVYRELLQGGTEGDTSQKLRMLLGDDATDRLISAAQRETHFQSAYDRTASNSRTAVRQQLIEDMQTPKAPDLSLTALANRVPLMPVQSAIQAQLNQGSERTRQGVANILTAQGQNADPVITALLNYVNRRRLPASGAAAAVVMPSAVEQGRQAYER